MKNIFLIFILIFVQSAFAQYLEPELKKAYDAFEGEKVDSLLVEANANLLILSPIDKVVFHKFSAFKAFQNNQTEIVMDHFNELITLDPSYTLDALTTSPKLIMLFDKAKIKYLQEQQRLLHELTLKNPGQKLPWRSLIFPGWEQWNRGAKIKAYTWAALGTITLSGTIQSIIRTSSKKQIYLDEKNPKKIKAKFDSYNDVYQSQFYWAYALSAVWVVSHIDAVFFTAPKNTSLVIIPDANKDITLNLVIHF